MEHLPLRRKTNIAAVHNEESQAVTSARAGRASMMTEGSAVLDETMTLRMQRMLDHQIPTAEHEADDIATGAAGARTAEEVKSRLGDAMGADFSEVRFHTGADAAAKADDMGARAYTSGRDVYFGSGGFDPSIAAHELVHTAQQGAVESSVATSAAPMGGVQMFPNIFGSMWRGIKKGATAVKEFVGGKLGMLGPSKADKRAAAERAQSGDYSQTARMKKEDMQQLVDMKKQTIGATLPGSSSSDIVRMYGKDQKASLNPVTRKAMSQMAKDQNVPEADRGKIHEALETMDKEMMVSTMRTPGVRQRARLINHYMNMDDQKRLAAEYNLSSSGKTYLGSEGDGTLLGAEEARDRTMEAVSSGQHRGVGEASALADADIARSQGSGDALLRTMFLMQLGDFTRQDTTGKKKTKQTASREWDQTMANAFAHGGRTGFLFGAKDTDAQGHEGAGMDEVTDAIFGANMGAAAGVHTRAAGTHHILTPKVGEDMSKFTEKSGVGAAISSSRDSSYQHYGMDMAIGGVGQEGTAGEGGRGQLINADGRSGHMYIGKKQSSRDSMGALLMGLESDSPYRMNQTGHMHNAAAVAEEGSSTGGLKTDIQGDKYGGRTVNLSGLKNEELVGVLRQFNTHMQTLRSGDEGQKAQYEAMLQKIAGKRMDTQELYDMMNGFIGDKKALESILTRARQPQLHR